MLIKLKINAPYGKVGDVVNVGPAVGDRLIKTGQAELVVEISDKSLTDSAAPRKATKIANKAVGR